ncbi:RPA-interacting protein [Cocos nucifera]|uniref:RPA-interacting protein n=1 Tax=Cocos nucifera TaxID=13894 RepID=A0A8K0HXZ0_COCNU|nr:RPA-interacting protein [Cocos nucifera]
MDGNRSKRASIKTQHPNWKEKLRQNCLRRVQKERAQLLWKIRSSGQQSLKEKEIVETAFKDIVSDELQKIEQSSLSKNQITFVLNNSDLIWEFDGLHTSGSTETESEELMLEMERLLYEDLREELIRRELEVLEEEDEYLARTVFEHMQLNDEQNDKVWCPICKRGELREVHHLIYCTRCKLRLDLENDKVTLHFLQDRLAEVHTQHLDKGCRATPKFCMRTMFNLTALYIQCQACNTFEIVV